MDINWKPPRQHRSVGDEMESRGGTGPRTAIGKERAKYNALKHGLFSKVVLMSHEDRSQFNTLLRGLRHDLKPEGMLQEMLVEKLVVTLWRYRRFLEAESGEVLKNVRDLKIEAVRRFDQKLRVSARIEQDFARTDRRGCISDIYDPDCLEICLDKLHVVREKAERFGLEHTALSDNLGYVYGARYSGRPGKDLFDIYLVCLSAVKETAPERESRGFASEVDCLQKFMAATEKEIRRLEGRRRCTERVPIWYLRKGEDEPSAEEMLRCTIPDSDEMDRLLRYESSLERAFERILTQLEQLKRMRTSQKTLQIAHRTTTTD